jgi:ubiquinone/menaquinone biosynthesis C-methylase UbiE
LSHVSKKYDRLATYYDLVYEKIVDYDVQARNIEQVIKKQASRKFDKLLDVACGTGNYTLIFARRGYNVTGVDISKRMLGVAKRKAMREFAEETVRPKFVKMDMTNLHLGETFDAALVLFGGFGYMKKKEQVENFFSSVKRSISHDGLLIFEFWNRHAVRPESLTPAGYNRWDRASNETFTVIRLHSTHLDQKVNVIKLRIDYYVLDAECRRVIDSFTEKHDLQVYTLDEMKRILESNGFTPLAFYSSELRSKFIKANRKTFRTLAVSRPS